jgi:alpha-mannosidase
MSTAPLDPSESEPEPEPEPVAEPDTETAIPVVPEAPGDRWTLIALIADDGQEPAANLSEREALGAWCAVSAPWHPALLANAGELPRIECVDYPSSPGPNEVRVLAEGTAERLPSGYRTQVEDAGTILVEAGADRTALVRAILGRMGLPEDVGDGDDAAAVARDYQALGTARWWLRDLTIAMGHVDVLDVESLTREVLAGAFAWRSGDRPAANNRLRAAFELLTQARERFYPVDAYLIDLCLLDPNMPAGALADALEARLPLTLLGPARAIENQALRDPERVAALREAIGEGWADVAGGAFEEVDEPLLPLESILWQFRRGGEVYRQHLDDRNVETLARRRFGLYPQLPQIGKRFGFRFAVHLGFDAGRFPIRPESKRLWEGPDGSNVEALTRPPLGADRAAQGLHLPWRLAQTMKDDHVATVGLVHWPGGVAPWYLDLRRVASYSPVLARCVTLNDYFHLTDRPYESFRPEPDAYVTPYLAQSVARRDPEPISRRAAHARFRARCGTLSAVRALALAILPAESLPPPGDYSPSGLEEAIETGRFVEARETMEREEPAWCGALARGIVGDVGGSGGDGGRPGYLVFNPLGLPRRTAVLLPDAAPDLRPVGPLRAAQFTDEGVWAVVDLPAFGFAWVPRETDFEAAPVPPGAVSASERDRLLRNESMEVEVDPATGGIRGLKASREATARLGQQLVVAGAGSGGSRMRCDAFEVDYAGPALVQAVSRGVLLDTRDERPIASFRQRYRLWTGRPILEIEVALADLDPVWLDRIAGADPWDQFLSCRWAWPDPSSMLRRTCLLAPELTEAERPETPDALDISTRRQRTALLFGGLAHHQRQGTRMLDTLLIAGRESARAFTLGVVLDLEHPYQAALDLITPPLVIASDSAPPASGRTGWLVQVDNKAVAVTRVEHADPSGDGRGWGLAFHLVETAGRPARCRLRLFRNPLWARQTDFNNELIVDLPVDEDAVLVDLTPHEIARVDVTLG